MWNFNELTSNILNLRIMSEIATIWDWRIVIFRGIIRIKFTV